MLEKKILFLVLLGVVFIGSIGLIFTEVHASEKTAIVLGEQVENVDIAEIPDSVKGYFESQGFNETNEITKTTVNQSDPFANPYLRNGFVNALVMYASSRKIDNTTGYTAYTVISNNSPMYTIQSNVNYASKNFGSTVNLRGSIDYNGGVYIFYSGTKGYRSIRASAQVYNTFGWGSVSASVGGLTLGR